MDNTNRDVAVSAMYNIRQRWKAYFLKQIFILKKLPKLLDLKYNQQDIPMICKHHNVWKQNHQNANKTDDTVTCERRFFK